MIKLEPELSCRIEIHFLLFICGYNQRWAAPTISRSRSAPAPANYDPLRSDSAPGLKIPVRLRSSSALSQKNPLRLRSSSSSSSALLKNFLLFVLKSGDVQWTSRFFRDISIYIYIYRM